MKKLTYTFCLFLLCSAWALAQRFAPAAPTKLGASAVSYSAINLAWTDNATNESKFEIEQSANGTTFTKIAEVNPDVTKYSVTGLKPNTKYYYRVRAANVTANSAYSNVADATTQTYNLAAPSNLSATAASTSQINLAWKDNSSGETDFEIERSSDGANFSKIATVTANTVSFNNTGLSENTKYYYRVRAYDKAMATYSGFSNVADATTISNTVNAPSELTLTPLLIDNKNNADLRWRDNSGDETGFEVELSTNGTSYTKVATTAANVTRYEVYLTTSARNYFRVRTIRGSSQSGYSNVADYNMGPESPLDLRAQAISSSQINLSWSDRSGDETGYEVERSGDGSNFSRIATLGANAASYSNTGLAAGTTYYYRVRGMKGPAGSAYTHIVNARTQDAPAPSPPAAPVISGSLSQNWTKNSDRVTEITASWQDKSDNETGFDVQWGDSDQYAGGAASVGANATQHKIEGSWPGCGHRVYVRVRSKNANGMSGWSSTSVVTGIAVPESPNNVTATAKSSSDIELKWGGANESYSRENRFVIQYSTSSNFASASEAQSDQNTDTKTIGGLNGNTTYYFRIKTQNCAGESGWSSTVNAKTQVARLIAPANLRLKSTLNVNQISIEWDDRANDETAYELSRSADVNTAWEVVKGDLAPNTRTYDDHPVRSGRKYFYRVRAVRSNEFSEYSNVLEATAPLVSGIEAEASPNCLVYPNPAAELLFIRGEPGAGYAAILYNAAGIEMTGTQFSSEGSLHVADFPAGIYLLKISTCNQSGTYRVIIQK